MKFFTLLFLFVFLLSCKAKVSSGNGQEYDVDAVENSFAYIQGKKYERRELEKLSKLELMLMEAEILGRKGILYGNFWQQRYVKLRTWFQAQTSAQESSVTGVDRDNLSLIRQIIKTKTDLLPSIPRPEGLRFKAVHTTLKFTEHKKIVSITGSISDADWKILLHREYGQERKDPVLKAALERMQGTTGFYKVYTDASGRVRAIDNYAGCCSVILSDKIKETYIFDENGTLLRLSRYYFGKNESQSFFYYNHEKIVKVLNVAYDVNTGQINEASVKDRVED